MQHIDDTITTVPDWFVKCYDSGVIWVVFAVLGILAIVLTIIACRLYYQLEEIQRFLDDKKED